MQASPEDFMKIVHNEDNRMEALRSGAEQNNQVLRMVAKLDNGVAKYKIGGSES